MSLPRVVAVTHGSPAAAAGLLPGDDIVALDGQSPRVIIEYELPADQDRLELELSRGGLEVVASDGAPFGAALPTSAGSR